MWFPVFLGVWCRSSICCGFSVWCSSSVLLRALRCFLPSVQLWGFFLLASVLRFRFGRLRTFCLALPVLRFCCDFLLGSAPWFCRGLSACFLSSVLLLRAFCLLPFFGCVVIFLLRSVLRFCCGLSVLFRSPVLVRLFSFFSYVVVFLLDSVLPLC